jgi:hypothetical protein
MANGDWPCSDGLVLQIKVFDAIIQANEAASNVWPISLEISIWWGLPCPPLIMMQVPADEVQLVVPAAGSHQISCWLKCPLTLKSRGMLESLAVLRS